MAQYASYHQTTETRNGESRTVEEVLVDNVLKRRVFENDALVHESERPFTGRRFAAIAPQRMVALRRALNSSTAGVGVLRRCKDDRRIGEVLLERARDGGLVVRVAVQGDEGLGDGLHGFHLHRCGDERNPDRTCGSLCEHYARDKRSVHGGLDSADRHEGDLGNVRSVDGAIDAVLRLRPGQLTLDECYGRAFVLHEGEDDLGLGGDEGSRTTGNSGGRYAYAMVGRL